MNKIGVFQTELKLKIKHIKSQAAKIIYFL